MPGGTHRHRENASRRCSRIARAAPWSGLLLFCLSWSIAPARAQVTDLSVVESGENAVLSWSTGLSPYRILRSDSPDFFFGNRLVAEGVVGGTFTDVDAMGHGEHSHYYLVLEDGEALPRGFLLNPPRPVPFITSLSPDSGAAGHIVNIYGGNFEPTGATMTVSFEGATDHADILNASETELTVQVPEGALTGDVFVCRSGVCSNHVLFKVVFGPSFVDLSSIAFEPGTGSLWAADREVGNGRVMEITSTGQVFDRGFLGQAILGHPSTADGTGRIYYSSSNDSDFNFGSIEYVDSVTNAEVFFDRAGESPIGTTVPVRCEGIAANDLEPDVAYFLDGRDDTIRRIVRDALAHDLMYGDQPFTFNSPAGARFDSAGNLYVSATTAIYRILPQEAGVELVADGFSAAAGIDLTEESGFPVLLVADEATGDVWLVNGETGEKEIVGSGFSGPVGVAFSEDPATGDLFYDVAEPTRILRLPDPTAQRLQDSDQRVLLSKHGPEEYPSDDQTDDGKIEVKFRIVDKVDPAGTTVYFRHVDPKDPSEYLNGQRGDNLPTSPSGSVTPSAVVGADCIVTAVLTVDPQYVGNNYVVELSFIAPPNFKKKGKSSTYTSWRRLYVEHDKMWKEGEFLTKTSGAEQGEPARVFVADPATFSFEDEVHILAGDSIPTSDGERGTVAAVNVAGGYVDLESPLDLTYPKPTDPSNDVLFPYSFLAKVAGEAFDVQPSSSTLAEVFDDGFTEWYILPEQGFIPHWPFAAGDTDAEREGFVDARSWTFFKHYDRENASPLTNRVQLVSAARLEESPTLPDDVTWGQAEATNQGGLIGDNWSWVFSDTIEFLVPGNVQTLHDYVTAHELGHQLNVNDELGNPIEGGHDEEDEWGSSGLPCLMQAPLPIDATRVHRFHFNPSAPSQDLLCIRTHVDDLNEDECPPFPGTTA